MAIVIKSGTFSGNTSDLSVPAGMFVTISCPACGHAGSQSGGGKAVAVCTQCGSAKDLRIEIGTGVVLDPKSTNEFKDCAALKGASPSEGDA